MNKNCIKPIIVSHSDSKGGAARAAYRLHRALRNFKVDSRMMVGSSLQGDWTIIKPKSKFGRAINIAAGTIDRLPCELQKSSNEVIHSPAWFSSLQARQLNLALGNVLNLHWICNGLLSIKEISKIEKPVVWTLHDMWAFCGSEHYVNDDEAARWRHGYSKYNRCVGDRGLDIDYWVYRRKFKHWTSVQHVICPSRWLASCVRSSKLMGSWPVHVIPNALDTNTFRPIDRKCARDLLNLPDNLRLVLFGAFGSTQDRRKGIDLLYETLSVVSKDNNELALVIFGESEPQNERQYPFPIHWVGHINDDLMLAILYSAVDVTVVPSRQENLPQIATEAIACGCPVVAFDAYGQKDTVDHLRTGYLATPYDPIDLAQGIRWILSLDNAKYSEMSQRARALALSRWSQSVVAEQYMEVYQAALG